MLLKAEEQRKDKDIGFHLARKALAESLIEFLMHAFLDCVCQGLAEVTKGTALS